MRNNLPLTLSAILNVIFLILLGFYLFTPFLDYSVVNTSMPRLCNYIENNQPELKPPFCQSQK